jgi:hypothetical protein
MTFTLITASAGVFFGLIGATLGVVNFVRALSRERVCVQLFPSFYHDAKSGDHLAVTIVNLSVFPITIQEVALALQPEAKFTGQSVTFGYLGGVELPKRMESRTSISVTFPPTHKMPDFDRVIGIYAMTECRHRFDAPRKSFLPVIEAIKKSAIAKTGT